MSIDKLKTKFSTGTFVNDVKHYFKKINEIIDYLNNNQSTGVGYKIYTPLLVQTGTNAPSVTVLENTMINPVTTQRSSLGNYQILCDDFIIGKVYVSGTTDWGGNGNMVIPLWDESAIIGYMQIYSNQVDGVVGFEIWDATFTRAEWSTLLGNSIMSFPDIKVYP